jgi:hypothetical protein
MPILKERTIKVTYDVAKHGGGTGTITLAEEFVPRDSIVKEVMIYGMQEFDTASGTAEISIGINELDDVLDSVPHSHSVFDDASLGSTLVPYGPEIESAGEDSVNILGFINQISAGSNRSGMIKVNNATPIKVTVAEAELTEGAIDIYVTFLVP